MKKNRKWRRNERTEHSTQMKWTNHKTQQKTHTKKYYIYRETQWEMTGTGAIHIIEPSSKAIMGLSSSSSGLVVFFVWHSPALILSVPPLLFFLSCLRWIGRPKVVENVTTIWVGPIQINHFSFEVTTDDTIQQQREERSREEEGHLLDA